MATSVPTEPKLTLTVPEAAQLLGISTWHCYQRIRLGELPVIRLGRKILIPRAALERMLASAMPTGTGPEIPRVGG